MSILAIDSNGKALEQSLKMLGLRVSFINSSVSPQVATYYFNFNDIRDYNKQRLNNYIDKLSIYYHKSFKVVSSTESHFGISAPLQQRQTLFFGSLDKTDDKNSINIGLDLANKNVILNFNKVSHLLIAGTTGSGKSVLLNTIIASLFVNMGANNFELYIIDPKRTEFNQYKGVSNVDYIDETTDAISILDSMVAIMEDRYKQFDKDFKHIFIVVDELADLMLQSRYDIEETIVRLAQKSRAVKMHLILATQRPTVNVITGLIKANMPNRVCLKMASQIDSRVVLDHKGADELLGRGDAILKLDSSIDEIRFQCAMISNREIEQLTSKLKGGN